MENDIDPLYPFLEEWRQQQAEPMPVFAKKRGRGKLGSSQETECRRNRREKTDRFLIEGSRMND
jgi:hypothetical protein